MIVVTTPTGQIGSHVARDLVEAGEQVRVVVRDAATLPAALGGRVDVIEGSHGAPDVIDRALDGAEALFWVAPNLSTKTLDESFIDFTRPAVDAIARHGVRRVVGVTALGRGTRWAQEAGLVTASLAMDDLLMASGAAYRGLAMPSFMENIGRQVQPMREKGLFFGPIDSALKLPWTATRDMGAEAARLLRDRDWAGQAEVPMVGPEELSHDDIAAILSEVGGRPIRYQQTGWDHFREGFIGRGASASFADGYVAMYRAKEAGMDSEAAAGADRLGRTTFREWAEQVLKPALAG